MEWKTSATDREVVNRLNRSLSLSTRHKCICPLVSVVTVLNTIFSSDWDFISLKLLRRSPQSTHPLLRHLQKNKYAMKNTMMIHIGKERKKNGTKRKMTGQRKRDHNNSRKGRSGWLCLGTFRLFFAVRSKTSTNAKGIKARDNNKGEIIIFTDWRTRSSSIHVKEK